MQHQTSPQPSTMSSHHGCQVLAIVESAIWSLIVRMMLIALPTRRVLQLLDRVPHVHTGPTPVPAQRWFFLAGRCLGRSIAQSQYLRQRKSPHTIIVGVQRSIDDFRAHAWIEQLEVYPTDFSEIWRIDR